MPIRRRNKEGAHHGAVPIGSLLDRYRVRLRPPQGVVVSAFCAVVEELLSIKLPASAVRYTVSTKTIGVTARGPEKSEIMLNKGRILTTCREVLGARGAPEHIV